MGEEEQHVDMTGRVSEEAMIKQGLIVMLNNTTQSCYTKSIV
jgi:hypothetical protein